MEHTGHAVDSISISVLLGGVLGRTNDPILAANHVGLLADHTEWMRLTTALLDGLHVHSPHVAIAEAARVLVH